MPDGTKALTLHGRYLPKGVTARLFLSGSDFQKLANRESIVTDLQGGGRFLVRRIEIDGHLSDFEIERATIALAK